MNPLTPLAERFANSYMPVTESGCWLWLGHLIAGYGRIRMGGGKVEGAHRASYMMHVGEVPVGLMVLHKCDIKCCVNPAHLYAGTRKQNAEDAVRRNRYLTGQRWLNIGRDFPIGEAHHAAKLEKSNVIEIRASLESCAALAQRFGISKKQISRIKRRETWRSLH